MKVKCCRGHKPIWHKEEECPFCESLDTRWEEEIRRMEASRVIQLWDEEGREALERERELRRALWKLEWEVENRKRPREEPPWPGEKTWEIYAGLGPLPWQGGWHGACEDGIGEVPEGHGVLGVLPDVREGDGNDQGNVDGRGADHDDPVVCSVPGHDA